MNLFGTFEHSIEVEQALATLENELIPRERLLVVPMNEKPDDATIRGRTDSLHSNAFEVGIACATGTAVIGASAGFVLAWGPILWGLIGAVFGGAAGYLIYYIAGKRGAARPRHRERVPAIVIVAQCTAEQAPLVKSILWRYQAITVGQVANSNSPP